MKKLLAILCTVALLLTSLFTGMAVAAEDTLTQLAPSSYGYDGTSHPSYDGAACSSEFVNATFTAMVLPLSADSTPFFQFGAQWPGLRFVINSDNVTVYYLGSTREALTEYPLTENYNEKAAYKITITAEMVNAGTAIADGEEFDATKHEHMSYDVYLDDTLVVENYIITSANITGYSNVTTGKYMRLQYCTVYDVDTFEEAFTATEADAAGDLDKLTTITPADFGVAYGDYYDEANGYVQGATDIDTANTVFETNIMFEYGGEMVYPRNTQWPGIKLAASGSTGLTISDFSLGSGWATATIDPATVNVGSLVGNMLNLKIALEIGDFDENNIYNDDGSVTVLEDDVRLTYYINDIKVWENVHLAQYDEYDENDNPVPESQTAETGTLLFTQGDKTFYSLYFNNKVLTEDPNCEVPVMLENAATTGGLVVGSLNTVDVTLAEGDSIAMGYYGTLAVTEGALVYTDKNGTATTVATDMAGVKFNLKTLAERVDLDGDGFVTEVKARVWVNNKATSAYQYLVGTLPIDQSITLSGTAALSAASQVPTDVREYTLADMGVKGFTFANTNGWANMANGTVPISTVNTIFSMKMNMLEKSVPVDNNRTQIITTYGNYTMRIEYGTDTLYTWFYSGSQLFAEWVSNYIPAVGTEFLYQVAVQQTNIDINGDGENNDIRVGYFVDGKLLQGKFFALNDVAGATSTTFNMQFSAATTNGLSTFKLACSDAEYTDSYANYEEIGIEDFGLENGTYSTDGSGRHWYNKASSSSLHNKVLKTKIKFVRAEGATGALRTELTYLAASNVATPIYISMETNGIGAIRYNQWGTKYSLPDLTENVEHDLMITSKMVEGHWLFGIYVDGKLQRNFYVANVGDAANYDYIGVHSWGSGYAEGSLVLGGSDYSVGATAEESYTVAASTDSVAYTINGEAVTEAVTLTQVGEYVISCTSTTLYGTVPLNHTGTKTVVIYKENDLNADNEVNILDFIAAQKSATEEAYDLGKVGAYAAGIAVGENCTAKEIVAIKIALLFAL